MNQTHPIRARTRSLDSLDSSASPASPLEIVRGRTLRSSKARADAQRRPIPTALAFAWGLGLLMAILPPAVFAQSAERGAPAGSTSSDSPAPDPPAAPAASPAHLGPEVAAGIAGPARFVAPLFDRFDSARALAHVTFIDRFAREPGNDGFEAVIDRILETLRAAGFGSKDHLELEVIETREAPGWSPVRGALTLLSGNASDAAKEDGERDVTLLEFDAADDRHRTMLPTGAASGVVEGPVVFSLGEVTPGSILVTGDSLGPRVGHAQLSGAVAVLSARISSFNQDPSGAERHLDAIRYGRAPRGAKILVGHLSLRAYEQLRAAAKGGTPRVRFESVTKSTPRKLRTVVATVVGSAEPGRVVPIAGHVQEPGAVDNASGVGGLLEAAVALAGAIEEGVITRPRRSVAFVWGNEMEQSRVFLDHTKRAPIVAISADMIGASRDRTGAMPLLERDPDPGALHVVSPDAHTPWGAGRVTDAMIQPSGLSLIARTALRDVATHVGGWQTREHPYEGGSDHDVFIRGKVPAILFWCFTDFAYHTSLDRLDHVDPEVMRRLSTTILATALAIADPAAGDLPRYRSGLALDAKTRLEALRRATKLEAKEVEKGVERWQSWYAAVEAWLEKECAAL